MTLTDVACTSSANSCSQTNSGTIQANGSCSASTPANPAGYGNACTSAGNACGQTNSGTIQCNGSCSASAPSNSSCPPSCTLSASPTQVNTGQYTTFTWVCTNTTSCTSGGFDTGGAANNSTGVRVVPPAGSNPANYQLSCTGPGGSSYSNIVPVTVVQPSAYITAAPSLVVANGSTNVSWSAAHVSNCTVSSTGGDSYNSGTLSGPTIATTTVARTVSTQTRYTITCPGESVSASILVNVVPSVQEF